MEYEKGIKVTPERTEMLVTATAEGVERLTTVHEIKYAPQEEYHGPMTITPSAETQILITEGLLMPGDLTINPIPSNYGLITWNGSTLTVS